MKYNSGTGHRVRRLRLHGREQKPPEIYFITIFTHEKKDLLGDRNGGKIVLNGAGRMVEKTWVELESIYPDLKTDEFVIMPYGIQGILFLSGESPLHGLSGSTRHLHEGDMLSVIMNCGSSARSLPGIIHRFKSYSTTRYQIGTEILGWPHIPGRLWQRNYYERAIRNGLKLSSVRRNIRKAGLLHERNG